MYALIFMSAKHVFFFRGLSTYGSDNIRWGLLDFGPMHKYLQRELSRHGLELHAIEGMGAGTLAEVSARAWEALNKHPLWLNQDAQVHFLGHSAGGLVGRVLLSRNDIPKDKVASFLSVATPHQGTGIAEVCMSLHEKHPYSYRALRMLGYNTRTRVDFFKEFTRGGITNQLRLCPGEATADRLHAQRVGSLVCALPVSDWCWPLRMMRALPAFRTPVGLSDGLIERDSQVFGEVVAEMQIDHFRQLGYFDQYRRFAKMCETISEYFLS